jgi:hypothetical protein
MSEQENKSSWFDKLDRWTDQAVVEPLIDGGVEAQLEVRRAIRNKVLESYRNGIATGFKKAGFKAAVQPKKEHQR